MIDAVDHNLAFLQGAVHIAVFLAAAGTQIASVIRAYRAETLPVILRMNQNLTVLCLPEVENRFQHLIFHLNQAESAVHRLLCLSRHDRSRIACKTQPLIQNQPVIGAGLRIRLPRHGKTLIRHILISQYTGDPVHLGGSLHIDFPNQRMSVRTPKHLDNQAVLRR